MKPIGLLKVATIAVLTSGFMVGCQQSATEGMAPEVDTKITECAEPDAAVRNAIYAAKLKNARARNLGADWEATAKKIDRAELLLDDECDEEGAMKLAKEAEADADAAIKAMQAGAVVVVEETAVVVVEESPYLGGYLVVSGDNLWNIAGQDTIYSDPYMWPLIYKANSGQIKDADLIFPGQYFYIPKAGGSERAAAMEHAKNRGAWTLGEVEASDLDYLSQ